MLSTPFNDAWTFQKEVSGSNSAPIPVTLPHDAMHYETRTADCVNRFFTGFYPGGVYRYKKNISYLPEWKDKTLILEFEGVYHRSKVFVNGTIAGGRPSGYTLFHVRIDHLLVPGNNQLEVLADTSDSINTRWYSGSGIYRPVFLLVGGPDRISPFGLKLTTISVEGEDRVVEVGLELHQSDNQVKMKVRVSILDRNNKVVKVYIFPVPSGSQPALKEYINIEGAALWSLESPVLYTAKVELLRDDFVLDTVEEEFGIRVLALDIVGGFQINGCTVKLRGACIHHDNGVIGATTLDMAEDRRVRILKEAGFNAIRSSHMPISRGLLKACDRRGVLIMDELTDVWQTPKMTKDYARDFMGWWERDATSMINKNYNHPSVVINSIGNEIEATATSAGILFNKQLAQLYKSLDPKRFTTNGINGFMNMIASEPKGDELTEGKNTDEMIAWLNHMLTILELALPYLIRLPWVDTKTKEAFADLDIAGYNYMVERYQGDVARYPERFMVGTETKHKNLTLAWPLVEKHPQILGDFVWTGWDYLGEAGVGGVFLDGAKPQIAHPWPGLFAYTPLIDVTGLRQTASYLSKIVWKLSDGPYLFVQPLNNVGRRKNTSSWRTTDSISSWSWEGFEGVITVVEVYANAHWVELLLNGKRIGWDWSGPKKGYRSDFKVAYQPGLLEAVSYDKNNQQIQRTQLESANINELILRITPEVTSIRANGQDLAYVVVELTDKAGIIRVLKDRQVKVVVQGVGYLLGFGSADYLTEEGLDGDSHGTHWGRALAVIRAGLDVGDIELEFESEGCASASIKIAVVAA